MMGRTQPRPALPAAYRAQIDHLRAQMLAVVDAHISLAQEDGEMQYVDRLLDLRNHADAVITRGGGHA